MTHEPTRPPASRRLKVGYSCVESKSSRRSRARRALPPMPYLRLRGRWLNTAGFDIGRNVRIEVNEGRLTIERID